MSKPQDGLKNTRLNDVRLRNLRDIRAGDLPKLAVLAFLAGTLVIILLIALGAMWMLGWGLFAKGTAEARGDTAHDEAVLADGDYRIAAYEHFFDLCVAVQSTEASIAALRAELDTEPSRSRVEQINASLTALTASRADLINQYNADATKEDTVAHFHASNLPHQLDIDAEETTCTAPQEE